MREKIKQLIVERIIEQGDLKVQLHNLDVMGRLTEESQNAILDKIADLEEGINKLKEVLKKI